MKEYHAAFISLMERKETIIPLHAVEMPNGYIFIQNVPVSINPVTEERFFSPETVGKIALIAENQDPKEYKSIPVYQY